MGLPLRSSRILEFSQIPSGFWYFLWNYNLAEMVQGKFLNFGINYWNYKIFWILIKFFVFSWGTVTLPRWLKVSSEILGSHTETMGSPEFPSGFLHFLVELQPCRDGSRWVPKFWDQLLKLWDLLNFNQVFCIFLKNCNLAEMVRGEFLNFWVTSSIFELRPRQGCSSIRKCEKPDGNSEDPIVSVVDPKI